MKVFIYAAGFEIKAESVKERQSLKRFVEFLRTSELIEGAGEVFEQLSEDLSGNHQITPGASAARALKKFAN